MAIERITETTNQDQLALAITNGDLRVLREICDEWGIKDEESVLRYALAVLSKATNHTLYYQDDVGEKVGLKPSSSLKRKDGQGAGE